MKTLVDIRNFFESYEVINELTDKKGIIVDFFESTSKNLLQIKIIEVSTKRGIDNNMFCDIKVQGTLVKMVFKFKAVNNELLKTMSLLKKSGYVINPIGNQISISIIDPHVSEVQKVFTKLEPYCRRFN